MVGLNEESRNFIINPIENLSHTLILERDQVYPHCLPRPDRGSIKPPIDYYTWSVKLKTIATW
jgi:hypothetical protein